jgi:glycerol-3-phosphate O-acyltransferase/dihydroxyacetone phosphate acyltransferase
MFYQFLKILVGFTLRIFFRKIFITGVQHIKTNKAQLVASNHPNGFLEPLIMACFFPKDLHFLVRGDVFENPFLKPILVSTHQIPIYRFRDGFSKLRENSNTMDESIQVLLDKKNLLIFAEGGTESIKKLRPLQKGIARIAFQALEKNPDLELEILPVGINFTYPTKFNETVMMRINNPINVQPFFKLYRLDKNKAVDALLLEISQRMKENIVHIDNQALIQLFERLVVVSRISPKYPYHPVYLKSNTQLDAEINIAAKIDQLTETDLAEIRSSVKELDQQMKKIGLSWAVIDKIPLNFGNALVLIIGFIPAVIGLIMHIVPLSIATGFTKYKVKPKEFKASILMVSALMLLMVQYLILIILICTTGLEVYWLLLFIMGGLWLRIYYYVFNNTLFVKRKNLEFFQIQAKQILKTLVTK